MRAIVTGSRDWPDDQAHIIHAALDHYLTVAHIAGQPLVLVHGACPTGADHIADQWAHQQTAAVAIVRYPADWDTHGHAAGPKRNADMVAAGANICLAFIAPCTSPRCTRTDPHGSHGATGCATLAQAAGIPVKRWTTSQGETRQNTDQKG